MDRRSFLVEPALVAAGLVLEHALAAAPANAGAAVAETDVTRLAAFLTAKNDLSAEFVSRAHGALLAEDATFDQRLMTLMQRLAAAGLPDVEAFRASTLAADPTLMATAIALIGALYTGRVGQGYRGHLVSYEEALMYRPTADVLSIPTYSRAVSGYWTETPP